LRLAWSASPNDVISLTVITLFQGLFPVFTIYITKLVVDTITTQTSMMPTAQLVALWALGLVLGQGLDPWRARTSGNLNERLSNAVLLGTIRKANSFPNLEPFEDQNFYSDLQTIYNEANFRPINFVFQTLNIATAIVASVGFLSLLGSLAWWIPVLILATGLPNLIVQQNVERSGFWWEQRSNRDRLMMMYARRVATTDEFAKEVRVYGVGEYFERKYVTAFESMHSSMRALRNRKFITPIPTALFTIAGNGFAFYWIVAGVMSGSITAGSAVLFIQSLAQLQGWVDAIVRSLGHYSGTIEFFGKYFSFLSSIPSMKLSSNPSPLPDDLTICFDKVSFAYPDGREALDNVSFVVRPGERIALVGENGAGKTTIVKLLARLYDPTSGRITVGGVDLRDLDLDQWRSALGAVFQDFVRYQVTVRENIAIGSLDKANDDRALESAARHAGFNLSEVGLDVVLGKQFDGTELSGGQWQKLATSRAFLREARVLILDEPSAALDPQAEATLFEQFSTLSAGKTTFLVTHRLASTAKADRILVLESGKLVEMGAHSDLMRANSRYATLYRVQAEQYESNPM